MYGLSGMKDTDNKTERLELRMSASDLAMLDALRRIETDIPSRSEMVRRLIERSTIVPRQERGSERKNPK